MKVKNFVFLSSLAASNLLFADTAKLDSVVISATGFEQDADSNIRNVIVISGNEIEEKGYVSIEEALSRAAGISFVRSGTGGNPSTNIDMRGQGDRANFSVKVMVDGIAMNTLDQNRLHAAGVTISPLDSIAVEDIERIEIIPGGGAVLYGNGTRGGVINIITKKNKSPQASVGIKEKIFDSGNHGQYLLFDFTMPVFEKLTFSSNINLFNAQGYRQGDKQNGFYANSKFYYTIDDRQDLSLALAYFKDDEKGTGGISKQQANTNPTQKGSGLNSYIITRPELNLEYNFKANDKLDFKAQAFYQNQRVSLAEDNQSAYSVGEFKDSIQGLNLKANFAYLPSSYFVFGYDFQRHNSNTYSVSFARVNSDDTKDSHSVFALDSHEFNDIFILSAGARYEYALYRQRSQSASITTGVLSYQSAFDTHSNNFALELTPNIKYSDTGRFYAKYERGYISPTPYQFRQSERVGGVSVYSMNQNLKSEHYDTYEIGLSDYLFGFYGLDLALFYTLSTDEITSRNSGQNPHLSGFGFYNLDKTRRYGLEMNLRQDFDDLSFYESLAFVDARIVGGDLDGKRIPLVSKIKATAGVSYELIDDLNVFMDLTYASKSREDARNLYWVKEHFLADIGATYTYKNLNVFAGVKNLFDYRYFISQSASSDLFIPADGRSYYLELKYKF